MNCPKHVEFHAKIKFEISASSWFYFKEICYDARLHERKNHLLFVYNLVAQF